MQHEVSEACRRVALALVNAHRQKLLDSVIFASAWHGEGTSTVVAHVASQLQRKHGLRVKVLDLRSLEMDVAATPMLDAVPPSPVGRNGSMLLAKSSTTAGPLSLGNLSTYPVEPATETPGNSALEKAMRGLGTQYDFLIIDAPPLMESGDAFEAGALVPRLVLVVQAGRTQSDTLEQIRTQLATFHVQLIATVLNRYRNYIPKFIDRWLTQ